MAELSHGNDVILKGAYNAEEFADEIDELRTTGLPPGESLRWPFFDPFYTVPRGQWTVLTGLSGSGKSTWLDSVTSRLAQYANWKFLYCSPENQPIKRHVAALMEIYSGKKFGVPESSPNLSRNVFMTEEEHRNAFAFVCEHFYFINPPETQFTVDGIIAIADKVYHEFFKFDGFILDPYNEIDHKRPPGMLETDYVSWVIQRFRNQNRIWNSHLWFVAHPTKPQRVSIRYTAADVSDEARKPVYQRITLFDISGSAHWKSKCDFGIIVHRDMNDAAAPSIIEVEKVRFRENGRKGEVPMYYDYLNNRFVEETRDLLFTRVTQ